jgi:predicted nucleic acid-binding protein
VQAELHARAAHRLAARGNQKVGFVDCASFVLMEHLGLRTAFAYDRDFEREGFELMTRAEQVGG